MKMQLLIASILLSLVSCCKRNDLVRINNYEFHSLYSFGKELKICSDVDVVHNIIESKKIKGPVIGTNSVRYAVSDSGDMRSLVFQVFLRLQS